jgi:hypothetical protein
MYRRIKPRTSALEVIWSLLLADLVIGIGNSFLAKGDVDYYMAMRAVCRSWRAVMVDPKKHPADPRFLLREWVMLDEELPRGRKTAPFGRIFLNTATGRFLHRDLPELANYYLITSTGGLLVLARRSSAHTVLVVNPFTASCITFKVPMPDSLLHTVAHLRVAGTAPTLVLEHPTYRMAYLAKPDDEHFAEVKYNLLDKAHNILGISDDKVDDLLSSIITPRFWEKYFRFYFVQSAGEMLLVLSRKHPDRGIDIFKVNFEKKVIEPTTRIGSGALFLGERCVYVHADKLPSIDGNCVFYLGRGQHDGQPDGIYMYDLKTEKEERIANDFIQFIGLYGKPVTPSLVQILMNYCTNIPWSQLESERRYGFLEEEHIEE